jgi:hypothetical protein
MEKIYSKVNPDLLLCTISEYKDIKEGRMDLSPENEFLQGAVIKEPKWKKFRAHKHLPTEKKVTLTQESWIVLEGAVIYWLYDINDERINWYYLTRGDCVMTFNGGHSYEIVSDNTIVYEFKNGPYISQKADKEYIDD